jgi:hypothetical protein
MKRGVATVLIGFLAMLVFVDFQFIARSESPPEPERIGPIETTILAQYEKVDSIHIRSNSEFELVSASGTGTPSDPYVLKNLEINSSQTCIRVEDTTAHFTISNCRLESYGGGFAVHFINVANGMIANCDCRGIGGITIVDSTSISIEDTIVCRSSIGIHLNRDRNVTVKGCTLLFNYWGTELQQTSNSLIQDNLIYGNWHNGVWLDSSSYNDSVYGNSIGWNNVVNQGFSNARDNGGNNHFDNGVSIGNLWSDYDGVGIYIINIENGSIDSFPQKLEDNIAPVLDPVEDVIIDFDTVGNILTWVTYDEYPRAYRIHEDNKDFPIAPWMGGNITFSLDHLEKGPHEINITLYDGAGNEALDRVRVLVYSSDFGGVGTELVMIASLTTVIWFVVILGLIKKLS